MGLVSGVYISAILKIGDYPTLNKPTQLKTLLTVTYLSCLLKIGPPDSDPESTGNTKRVGN